MVARHARNSSIMLLKPYPLLQRQRWTRENSVTFSLPQASAFPVSQTILFIPVWQGVLMCFGWNSTTTMFRWEFYSKSMNETNTENTFHEFKEKANVLREVKSLWREYKQYTDIIHGTHAWLRKERATMITWSLGRRGFEIDTSGGRKRHKKKKKNFGILLS